MVSDIYFQYARFQIMAECAPPFCNVLANGYHHCVSEGISCVVNTY